MTVSKITTFNLIVVTLLQCLLFSSINSLDSITRNLHRNNQGYVHAITTRETQKMGGYDFIIVGGGTAGSVVANRLSENPDWTVLILEAGDDESFLTDIPGVTPLLSFFNYDWNYKTEPQEHACLAMTNRQCVWRRGRVLGGTSTVNDMIYSRGNKLDYDEWANLGNKGWSYEDVLPYFLKSENSQIPGLSNTKYHRSGGYLNVQKISNQFILGDAFLEASVELGYNLTSDYNGENQLGFSEYQVMQSKSKRCSAATAFLRPIQKRNNLHISLKSKVTKLIIDSNDKKVIGVEFIKNNLKQTVKVKKEIVLSAGALNSPKILMLSGIGPKEHLDQLGIPVVKDNENVGNNLQDHVGFLGMTFLINDTAGFVPFRLETIATAVIDYFVKGKGELLTSSCNECLGFIKTKYATDERPDLELLSAAGSINTDFTGNVASRITGLSKDNFQSIYGPIVNKDTFGIFPILLNTKSKGFLKLNERNPFSSPKFFPNLLTDQHDITILKEGIKIILKLSKTKAFQKYGATLHGTPVPGCRHFDFGSEQYWECAIRHLTLATNHQVGTCRMGPTNDTKAVVDYKLKVYGVQGLRVVDASIMPRPNRGHTAAVCYMIGEKASDLIKDDWMIKA